MTKEKLKKIINIASILLAVVAIILIIVLLAGKNGKNNDKKDKNPEKTSVIVINPTIAPTAEPTEEPTAEPTPEPITFEDYTIVSAGDAMLYASMVDCAKKLGAKNGTAFDFSDLTKYVKPIISDADLAVFNLEATMSGAKSYTYYPEFDVPDEFITTLKETGFDVALFANNHVYDTRHEGLIRTQELMKSLGNFEVMGARKSVDEKSYGTVKVGEMTLGILNYTYEAPPEEEEYSAESKFLNGIRLDKEDVPLVDSFNYNLLDNFYKEVETRISDLKENNAEFITMYIHWGEEYEEHANENQRKIAQKLCDLGVDLIVGSHPHVVQPVETFTSDNGHKMLCYYSTGNFTSAQNRKTFKSGDDPGKYTENELLVIVKIRRYSNGETAILHADYEPLWQHRHDEDGRLQLPVVPVRKALADDAAKDEYGLTKSSFGVEHAKWALDYITSLVQPGIDEFNNGITLP